MIKAIIFDLDNTLMDFLLRKIENHCYGYSGYTGCTGVAGWSGYTGTTGYTGTNGFAGTTWITTPVTNGSWSGCSTSSAVITPYTSTTTNNIQITNSGSAGTTGITTGVPIYITLPSAGYSATFDTTTDEDLKKFIELYRMLMDVWKQATSRDCQ